MNIHKIGAKTAITGLIGITSLSVKKIGGLSLIGFTNAIADELGLPTFGLLTPVLSLVYHKLADGAIGSGVIITIIQGALGYAIGSVFGGYLAFALGSEEHRTAVVGSFAKKLEKDNPGLKTGPVTTSRRPRVDPRGATTKKPSDEELNRMMLQRFKKSFQ